MSGVPDKKARENAKVCANCGAKGVIENLMGKPNGVCIACGIDVETGKDTGIRIGAYLLQGAKPHAAPKDKEAVDYSCLFCGQKIGVLQIDTKTKSAHVAEMTKEEFEQYTAMVVTHDCTVFRYMVAYAVQGLVKQMDGIFTEHRLKLEAMEYAMWQCGTEAEITKFRTAYNRKLAELQAEALAKQEQPEGKKDEVQQA